MVNKEQSELLKEEKKTDLGYYFGLREVMTYFFRKKDPNRPTNFNIKAMHTINKISILMFLMAVIIMIVRVITRSF